MAAVVSLTWKARAWRLAKRLLRTLVVMYVLVGVGMYAFQDKLVFPGAARQGQADTHVRPALGETLVNLQAADGAPLTGLFGEADPPRLGQTPLERAAPRPTVLFFYGNGMCMNDTDFVGDKFRKLGYHCMLVDYEGYGMSGGKPSEQGCYNAAEAAYHYVLTRPDVDKSRLIAAGWSLGSGVAVDLAWRHREDHTFCALMTFSGMSSMVDVGQHHYPFLPVGAVLRHRFMAIDKIRDIKIPYFCGHGRHDSIIPFVCSERLAAAYGGGKEGITFLPVDTDHNDFFDEENKALMPAMEQFLHAATC